MSKNKLVPIITIVICLIIVGSVFAVSSINKKSNAAIDGTSQPQTSSQTGFKAEGETKSTSAQSEASEESSSQSSSSSTAASVSSASSSTNASSVSSASTGKSESSKTTGANAASISKTTTTTTKKTTAKKSEYLYAYAGFNPVTTDMNVPIEKLLLNRKYKLPDGYVPTLKEAVKGSGVKLDYRVAPHYQEMYNAAKKDGITLTPVSGYRSYQRQKNNFDNQIRTYMNQGMDKVTATQKAAEIRLLPGTSEHNAGLAMDICSLSTSFENTKEFKWLQAHAHEYGFIMRYPKDKTNVTKIIYEPWHYRYVGKDIASQLKSSGMVLEEYLGKSA